MDFIFFMCCKDLCDDQIHNTAVSPLAAGPAPTLNSLMLPEDIICVISLYLLFIFRVYLEFSVPLNGHWKLSNEYSPPKPYLSLTSASLGAYTLCSIPNRDSQTLFCNSRGTSLY